MTDDVSPSIGKAFPLCSFNQYFRISAEGRMKAIELAKAYDPKSFEDSIYAKWKDEGYFHFA